MSSNLRVVQGRGAGDGKLVLCLPGTLCPPWIFPLHTEVTGFRLVGVNWIESPGPWDIESLASRVVELVDELGERPAIIAGHSTGGAIAMLAALEDARAVRGLLVSNSGADVRGHGDAESILGSFRDNWNPEFHRRFLARNFHTALDEEELQRFVSWAGSVPQQAAADALASQVSLDFSDRIGDISVPVVFGHGRHDLARLVDSAESLTRRVSNSQLRLLEAGHSPMYDDVPGWTRALEALDVMIGQQV